MAVQCKLRRPCCGIDKTILRDANGRVERMPLFLSAVGATDGFLLGVVFEAKERSHPRVIQPATAVMTVKSVTGRFPMLYTGRYMLTAPNAMLSQCPLWL